MFGNESVCGRGGGRRGGGISTQVYPKVTFLLEHVLPQSEGDSPPVGQAKTTRADYLRQRYPFSGLHYAATILDPRFRALRFLTPPNRQTVQGEALNFLRKYVVLAQNSFPVEDKPEEPKPKKRTPFEESVTKSQVG